MGGDAKSLMRGLPSRKQYLPLLLAKHVPHHVLQGLMQVHSLDVAYTDLNLDIPSLLTRDPGPSRLNIPEQTWESTMQTAVSQPLSSLDVLLTWSFFIADFGSDYEYPCALRALEIILHGPWNQRVDIWTFGCLHVFKLPDRGLDAAAGHLWQMISFTGKDFEPKRLSWSHRAIQYFEKTICYLKSNPPVFCHPFEKSLRNYKVISEEDVLCLRLDPDARPSAKQLLDDPFWVEKSV
ncbi:hypothetical protein DFS33DRAFT_1370250 [Desarmillaria ectypa]|nr:hypothetical protein DFS33DRAFT_1370250 [Desarmillaria ectypa]